jgi:hypothetical protein
MHKIEVVKGITSRDIVRGTITLSIGHDAISLFAIDIKTNQFRFQDKFVLTKVLKLGQVTQC